ncbi:MAG: hypothetical protein QM308_07590 [Bacillota bacterium]|nr:hypothetical protein [Bacillota bacterium]
MRVMRISFPEYLTEEEMFYQDILRKLLNYLGDNSEKNLYIDMTATKHISPGILCQLLCFLQILKKRKNCLVAIEFGPSRTLSSYLGLTGFFLLANLDNLIDVTDIINYESPNTSAKSQQIQRINELVIPSAKTLPPTDENRKYLPENERIKLINAVSDLFDAKQDIRRHLPPSIVNDILRSYKGLLENAHEHAFDEINDTKAYYTFQYYSKTGLTLSLSDCGPGFYSTLLNQYRPVKENARQDKVSFSHKIFSYDEYLEAAKKSNQRELVAIIESIFKRANENYGLHFILSEIVGKLKGTVSIHSVNTLLKITPKFWNEYLKPMFDSLENATELRLVNVNQEKLKSIVYDVKEQQRLIKEGVLKFYSYDFTGVHITAEAKLSGEQNV